MDMQNHLFAIKLYELQQNALLLESRIRLCQKASYQEILSEKEKIKKELEENELILKNQIQSGRFTGVKEFARAQEEYCEHVDQILKQMTNTRDQTEMLALCGQYSIDLAIQAMRYALLSVYNAMESQYKEKEENENE